MGQAQCCIQEDEDRTIEDGEQYYYKKSMQPSPNAIQQSSRGRKFQPSTIHEEISGQVSSKDYYSSASWIRFPTEHLDIVQRSDRGSEIFRASTMRTGTRIVIRNIQSKLFLHSHSMRLGTLKNAYEVTVAKAQLGDYLEWFVWNDNGTLIQHNDLVRIEHCLTGYKLCGLPNPFTKSINLCCSNHHHEDDQDAWTLIILSQDASFRVGSVFQLQHGKSGNFLTLSKQRAAMKNQTLVGLVDNPSRKYSTWKVEWAEMASSTNY